MSREDAAEKMRELADKIGEGRVELTSGDDSIELTPADQVEFELDVEEENDGEISIEVEIEWSSKDQDKEVKIS